MPLKIIVLLTVFLKLGFKNLLFKKKRQETNYSCNVLFSRVAKCLLRNIYFRKKPAAIQVSACVYFFCWKCFCLFENNTKLQHKKTAKG